MGLEGEFGPVADGRVLSPTHQAPHLVGDSGRIRCVGFWAGGKGVVGIRWVGRPGGQGELAAGTADLTDPLAADVVAPTFEDGECEAVLNCGRHQWEVLVGQLVLESLGGRGDHDLLAGQSGRHEIGE
jgi:hypothetical protein